MNILQDSKNLYYLQSEYENIPIYIHYDQYKTVRFKVRPNLRVEVSAPYYISQTILLNLIKKRQNWILENLGHRESKLLLDQEYALENAKKFRYLGHDFVIEVQAKNQQRQQVVFKNGKIIVYLVNIASSNELKIVLTNFCYNQLKTLTRKHYLKYANYFAPHFVKHNLSGPFFVIKKMKRTWGIYKRKGNKVSISLNSKLIEFPVKCIEYVVLHELCHSLQANHSAKYWQIVSELMPEHKKYNEIFKTEDD